MEFPCSKATFLTTLTATLLLSWMLLGSSSSLLLRPLGFLGLTLTSRMTSTTPSPYSMVFVSAPNKEVAETLAGGMGNKTRGFDKIKAFLNLSLDPVVSGKMAACVNIIPGITSVYEWEGKIEKDQEMLLMIKTR